MKILIILSTLFLVVSTNVFSRVKTLPTTFRCEQDVEADADTWIEVGVTINDGFGWNIYVVSHPNNTLTEPSADISIAKFLLVVVGVDESRAEEGVTLYQDSLKTNSLKIVKNGERFDGTLKLEDRPDLNQAGLQCFNDGSEIRFNTK